jgi:hypothetical protein
MEPSVLMKSLTRLFHMTPTAAETAMKCSRIVVGHYDVGSKRFWIDNMADPGSNRLFESKRHKWHEVIWARIQSMVPSPRFQIVPPRQPDEARLVWGSIYDLDDMHLYVDHNIQAIISLGMSLPEDVKTFILKNYSDVQEFRHIAMNDAADQDLEEPFRVFYHMMDDLIVKKHLNVFVHCQMGWNRSAALLMLWLRNKCPEIIPSYVVMDWRLRRSPNVLSNRAFEQKVI